MKKIKALEFESFNSYSLETYENLFKEKCIKFQTSKYYKDYGIKFKEHEFKLKDFIKKYYNLKNEYQKQSLILQQINKYRAKYKKEKEELQKIIDYD